MTNKSVSNNTIIVNLAYAEPSFQINLELEVPASSTIAAVILHSRILEQLVNITLENIKVGIFGQLKDLTTVVTAGDRIEIYRPLMVDPKTARWQRIKNLAFR